ncbi:MAG: serine/threonine protein kinase [Planctomycetes bacterium]|nr:serine/threonine protein kinase [Planctomycetota bacterium]
MIGNVLRGYSIVDKIKDGSVGTVWRCVNGRNDVFALKQISRDNAQVAGKIREFKKEATLTRRLKHRHIIRVVEYVAAKPQPFFVMEYFDSENLKFAMWHRPQRVHKHEFSILRQIAEALAHIHSLGIIHRDVKPENVLVAADSDCRLIDFSLAQTAWDRFWPWNRRAVGTPLYMAPEQIRGERCDARTDVYGFGATMFELLTKRPPFIGTSSQVILRKHVTEPPPSIRSIVRTVAPELDAVVQRMMAKKAQDRFPDMASIIYELSKWEKKDTQVRIQQVEPARKGSA